MRGLICDLQRRDAAVEENVERPLDGGSQYRRAIIILH